MRLTSVHIFPALCCHLVSALQPTGDVYIFNPHQAQQPRPDRTLSPVAARVVLAQRAGIEDFHSADLFDKDVIEAINDYGVRTPLFSQQGDGVNLRRAMILVAGMSSEDGMGNKIHSFSYVLC